MRGLLLLPILLAQDPAPLQVACRPNADRVPRHDVLELEFTHDEKYDNPFFDVTLEVTFESPSGRKATVGGFHFGSAEKPRIEIRKPEKGAPQVTYHLGKRNLWKARFAPAETGPWKYSYVFSGGKDRKAVGKGTFECVEGRARLPGFVRRHPTNPFRWVFDDGTPFFPVGLQDGIFDHDGTGTVLDSCSLEGPFRLDRGNRPDPPPGALFMPGPSSNPQNKDVYFRRYGRCGFNLLRFSQQNFSLSLYRDLDHWLVHESVMVDELLRRARAYGFRILYGLFGYHPVFNKKPDDAEGMAKVKRFVKYSVDRWGAYVDFWEFLNEQHADTRWYEIMIPYLRSVDPYGHPVTTSWERPEIEGIDINAPHWYQNEDELRSDLETAQRAASWKRHGKPVIVGEQGNRIERGKAPPGVGGVWDERSALRMRIRLWTAFFHEIVFVFWNTSYAKDGHYMNIWLGPREREYVRALQAFSTSLDADVRPVPVRAPEGVRAWGLASKERAGVYLHHFASHSEPARGVQVTLDVPRAARATWYSPGTGANLATFDAPAGRQTFTAPDFTVDLALHVGPSPPSLDRGEDDDGDGVPDAKDAFPLEPEEWEDRDGDLIGDNLDADVDADGRRDRPESDDPDGDGVKTAHAVPWDAFPLDPKDQRDTDGDGLGDNADPDDDGDGWTDEEEKAAGTDPLDRLSFPK